MKAFVLATGDNGDDADDYATDVAITNYDEDLQ